MVVKKLVPIKLRIHAYIYARPTRAFVSLCTEDWNAGGDADSLAVATEYCEKRRHLSAAAIGHLTSSPVAETPFWAVCRALAADSLI